MTDPDFAKGRELLDEFETKLAEAIEAFSALLVCVRKLKREFEDG